MRKLLFSVMLLLIFTSAQQREAQGPVYIIHSDKGRLENLTTKGATLIMEEVDQTIPFIFSHPRRRIGAERLPEFMRVWAAGNKLQYDNQDPPDAHMLYYNTTYGEYIDTLLELMEVDYNEKANSLRFELRFKNAAKDLKENLGEVTLFIDCFPYCV